MGNYLNRCGPKTTGYLQIPKITATGNGHQTEYRSTTCTSGGAHWPNDIVKVLDCGARQKPLFYIPHIHTCRSVIFKKIKETKNEELHVLKKNMSNAIASVGLSGRSNLKQYSCNLQTGIKGILQRTTSVYTNDKDHESSTSMEQVCIESTAEEAHDNMHVSSDLLRSNKRGGKFKKRKEYSELSGRNNKPKLIGIFDWKPLPGNDILYGISSCFLALHATRRTMYKVYMTPSFNKSTRQEVLQMRDKINDKGLGNLVIEVDRKDLDRITRGRPHQGICVETSRIYFQTLPEDSTEDDEIQRPQVHLVMDQILDPMNMGAILRSAYYLGVNRIIVSKHNCCSLTPVVSKASSGVMEVMPVYATRDVLTFLKKQRDKGWEIVGSTSTSSDKDTMQMSKIITPGNFNLSKPTTLVIGSEGSGLSEEIQDVCCQLLTIPARRLLHHGIDSLNVSVATGILLQSILQGRN